MILVWTVETTQAKLEELTLRADRCSPLQPERVMASEMFEEEGWEMLRALRTDAR